MAFLRWVTEDHARWNQNEVCMFFQYMNILAMSMDLCDPFEGLTVAIWYLESKTFYLEANMLNDATLMVCL